MSNSVCPDRTDVAQTSQQPSADERIRALEQALAQSQALFHQSPCGYLGVDTDLGLVHINHTLLDWLGLPHDARPNLLELIDSAGHQPLREHVAALCAGEESLPLELSLHRQEGSPLQALLTSTAVRDEAGNISHINSAVQDIGERQAAEQRLSAHGGFLQSITDRIPARLAYYDKDLVCRFSNSAHANRYGKLASEMVGSHLCDVVRPELLPEIMPRVAGALNGEWQTFDAEREASDGTRAHYQIHYIPDLQNGLVEGIFIELHDITERKRTEEFVLEANRDLEERVREHSADLFQSEQRYRLMVDAIQDYCIYFVDAEGVVTDWTESAQRLHGHSRADMIGKPYQDLLAKGTGGEDEVDAAQVMRLAQAHGQWETRGWRLRDDGSRFWAHTVLTALRTETGELQGLSAITRDMTAAKSLEDVMNDLNRELEKRVAERTQQLVAANKDLDVFSHMVSHDLRAPLRHISSFVSLLLEHMGETTDKLALQYLNNTAKASKRMSHMIEGLLEYARLGRVSIDEQPVPLTPLLEVRDGASAQRQPRPGHRVGDRGGPACGARRRDAAGPGLEQPAEQLGEIHPPTGQGANRNWLEGEPGGRTHVLCARQRRRLRSAESAKPVRHVPAPAPLDGLRGHRNRAGARAAHHRAAQRAHLGRNRAR